MRDQTHCELSTAHLARVRELDSTLGRWCRQDPLGYVDGANLYGALGSQPVGPLDPLGLEIVLGHPTHPQGTPTQLGQVKGQWDQAKKRNPVSWLILTALEVHPGTVILEWSPNGSDSTMIPIPPNNPATDGDPHNPLNPPHTVRINHDPANRNPSSTPGNPPNDPEATLVHESTHALLDLLGLQPRSEFLQEIIACIAENVHRHSTGLTPRSFYGEWVIPQFSGSTSRPAGGQ